MSGRIDDAAILKQMLTDAKTIAVVGHSDKPTRTSYMIAAYLRRVGYTVYAVNPTVDMIDGEPSYASLNDVPAQIDIVNVFRRSEHLPGVVEDAIGVGAPVVWAQLGVIHEEAVQRAEQAGINIVMDRCIKVERARLL